MKNYNEIYSNCLKLQETSDLLVFVKICHEEYKLNVHETSQVIQISEKFDNEQIIEYIDSQSLEKNEDHYLICSQLNRKLLILFVPNNEKEFMNIFNIISNNDLLEFYINQQNPSLEIKNLAFSQKYIVEDLSAIFEKGIISIEESSANRVFNLLKLQPKLDQELNFLLSNGLDDSTNIMLVYKNDLIAQLKPVDMKIPGLMEDVSSFFATMSKNAMDNSAKIAFTGALLLGLSLTTAMAGDSHVEQKVDSFNAKLESLQKDIGKDVPGCEFKVELVQSNGIAFEIKATLGDEVKLIQKTSFGSKNSSQFYEKVQVGSKKTGKCAQLTGNDSFESLKTKVIDAIKSI